MHSFKHSSHKALATKFWSLIAFPLQHLLPQTSCCRFNSFQMIMVLLHDPVSSILQPLLCFYNTLVYRWATWSVLWLYNAQVLLLPKPEVNDILHLRFVICGTMHPLWFHISKSESVPENLWFYQMLPGLEWDKKKKNWLRHFWSKVPTMIGQNT